MTHPYQSKAKKFLRLCVTCGKLFQTDNTQQTVCGGDCVVNTAAVGEVVLSDWCRAGVGELKETVSRDQMWRNKVYATWSVFDLWQWVKFECTLRGIAVLQYLDPKGRGQLQHLVTKIARGNGVQGVPIVEVVMLLTKFLRQYTVICLQMKLNPLTVMNPGLLVGYWPMLEALLLGGHGGFGAATRGDDKTTCAYDFGMAIETQDKDWLATDKDANSSLSRNWDNMPEKKWHLSTVWTMLVDKCLELEVPVVKNLRVVDNQKLRALEQTHGMTLVIRVGKYLRKNFIEVEREMKWIRPFRVGTFIAFFDGIYRMAQKVHPPQYFTGDESNGNWW